MAKVSDAPEIMRKMARAFRVLKQNTKATLPEIIRGEAGIILKTWAGRTKVATQARVDINSRVRLFRQLGLTGKEGSSVTINAGLRGPFGRVHLRTNTGRWRRTHDQGFKRVAGMPGKGRKDPGDHYTEFDWLLVTDAIRIAKAALPEAIAAGRAAIGLARQSVVQIADSIGILLERVQGGGSLSIAGIAKARAAIASTGRRYINGSSFEQTGSGQYFLALVNGYPIARDLKMDRTLLGVLSGRAGYLTQNLARGVFNSESQTARAYPWLQVRRGA
jgi:hypothetical protein